MFISDLNMFVHVSVIVAWLPRHIWILKCHLFYLFSILNENGRTKTLFLVQILKCCNYVILTDLIPLCGVGIECEQQHNRPVAYLTSILLGIASVGSKLVIITFNLH